MKPPYYVKFTGKFRDLPKQGYEFRKAFAGNYRVYSLHTTEYERITIWQRNGGYLEIDNFQEYSYLLIQAIQNKEHLNWKRKYYKFFDKHEKDHFFYVNLEEYTLMYNGEDNRSENPDLIYSLMFANDKEEALAYRRKFRQICLSDMAIKEIERLLENGMIEISDEVSKLYPLIR